MPTTSFPNSIQPDLERQKFVATQGAGEVAVRVANADGSAVGGGAGGGGTSMVDESNYVLGSSSENPIGLQVQADPPNQVVLGVAPADVKTAAWAGTTRRAGHVNLRNVAGTEIGTVANPLQVAGSLSGGVASPQTSTGTAATVAAGGQGTIDSTQVGSGKTGQLMGVLVSASVAWKAELRTVLNGVASATKAVWFGNPLGPPAVFTPPDKRFFQQAESATAGLDGFRVVVTNMDTSETADLYATFMWDEV